MNWNFDIVSAGSLEVGSLVYLQWRTHPALLPDIVVAVEEAGPDHLCVFVQDGPREGRTCPKGEPFEGRITQGMDVSVHCINPGDVVAVPGTDRLDLGYVIQVGRELRHPRDFWRIRVMVPRGIDHMMHDLTCTPETVLHSWR